MESFKLSHSIGSSVALPVHSSSTSRRNRTPTVFRDAVASIESKRVKLKMITALQKWGIRTNTERTKRFNCYFGIQAENYIISPYELILHDINVMTTSLAGNYNNPAQRDLSNRLSSIDSKTFMLLTDKIGVLELAKSFLSDRCNELWHLINDNSIVKENFISALVCSFRILRDLQCFLMCNKSLYSVVEMYLDSLVGLKAVQAPTRASWNDNNPLSEPWNPITLAAFKSSFLTNSKHVKNLEVGVYNFIRFAVYKSISNDFRRIIETEKRQKINFHEKSILKRYFGEVVQPLFIKRLKQILYSITDNEEFILNSPVASPVRGAAEPTTAHSSLQSSSVIDSMAKIHASRGIIVDARDRAEQLATLSHVLSCIVETSKLSYIYHLIFSQFGNYIQRDKSKSNRPDQNHPNNSSLNSDNIKKCTALASESDLSAIYAEAAESLELIRSLKSELGLSSMALYKSSGGRYIDQQMTSKLDIWSKINALFSLILTSLKSIQGESNSLRGNKVHPMPQYNIEGSSLDERNNNNISSTAIRSSEMSTVMNLNLYFSEDHISYIEKLVEASARQASLFKCLNFLGEKKVTTDFVLNSNGV